MVDYYNQIKKLENAIKDKNFVNILKNKFDKDKIDKLAHTLESNPFNAINGELKEWLEMDNEKNFKNILNELKIFEREKLNSPIIHTSINASKSNTTLETESDLDRKQVYSSNQSSEDNKPLKHQANNSYSSEYAIEILDKKIASIEEDNKALRSTLNDLKEKNKRLNNDLMDNTIFLNILKEERHRLQKNKSYDDKSSNLDTNINKVYNALNSKEDNLQKLQGIKVNDKKREVIVKKEIAKLEKQIANLKAMQGILQAKQRKITNKKLISLYKKSRQNAKKLGNKKRLEDLHTKLEKESRSSKMLEIDNSSSKTISNGIKYLISYHKYNVVDKYCGLLKKKNGIIKGVSQLPANIVTLIQNNTTINNAAKGISR